MPAPPQPSRIAPLVRQVSRANLERDVRHLSTAYPTRHTLSEFHAPCAEWIAARLRGLGYRHVSFHEYTKVGKPLRNVVCVKPGRTRRTLILCAHFDSRNQNLADAVGRAPGANDNATGTATVLEVARVLARVALRDSVRFVFFSGEEQGFWGSTAYLEDIQREKPDLALVFNVDQIGFPPSDRALFVDRDEGGPASNNAASAALVARVQELARTVVKVPTRVDPVYGSDYVPFEQAGYTVTGLYEAGKDYPAYHSTGDTMEKVDFAYVADMARLCLAAVATEAGL
jgi:hypothetical protein